MAFRSKSHNTATAGNSATATEPAGGALNDVYLAFILVETSNSTAPAISAFSGWDAKNTWSFSSLQGDGTHRLEIRAYTIQRGASAPNLSISWSGTTAYMEWMIEAYSGCAIGLYLRDAQYNAPTTRSGGADCPAVSVAVGDTIVAMAVDWAGNVTAFTAPSGYTIRDDGSGTGNDLMAADKVAASTSEDPGVFGGQGAGTWECAEATFALIPSTYPFPPFAPSMTGSKMNTLLRT